MELVPVVLPPELTEPAENGPLYYDQNDDNQPLEYRYDDDDDEVDNPTQFVEAIPVELVPIVEELTERIENGRVFCLLVPSVS